ncbi:MAG: hypothetical protein K2K14_07815 [Ruminococcus sp.]|nr:hypothetical protein [Ruminococcus sp.]
MKERYIVIPPDKWRNFIDIAFDNSKYFSITLFSDCLSSSKPEYEYMINELNPWIIDKSEAVWGEYEKKFYLCNYFTKKILLSVNGIDMFGDMFGKGKYPDDLCFYNDMGMWFENISHERTSFIILPECRMIDELKENGIMIF